MYKFVNEKIIHDEKINLTLHSANDRFVITSSNYST